MTVTVYITELTGWAFTSGTEPQTYAFVSADLHPDTLCHLVCLTVAIIV